MRLFPRFKHKQFIDTYLRDEPEQPTEEVIAGRRYRVDVPYVLPKDLQEVGRLDFQHYALRALLKGNYSAPSRVLAPRQILDVGCGTGRWCRDVANDCPQASITGLDLEAQWPTSIPLPPIIRFQQANILQGLPFAAGSFDYVHQRLLVGAVCVARTGAGDEDRWVHRVVGGEHVSCAGTADATAYAGVGADSAASGLRSVVDGAVGGAFAAIGGCV